MLVLAITGVVVTAAVPGTFKGGINVAVCKLLSAGGMSEDCESGNGDVGDPVSAPGQRPSQLAPLPCISGRTFNTDMVSSQYLFYNREKDKWELATRFKDDPDDPDDPNDDPNDPNDDSPDDKGESIAVQSWDGVGNGAGIEGGFGKGDGGITIGVGQKWVAADYDEWMFKNQAQRDEFERETEVERKKLEGARARQQYRGLQLRPDGSPKEEVIDPDEAAYNVAKRMKIPYKRYYGEGTNPHFNAGASYKSAMAGAMDGYYIDGDALLAPDGKTDGSYTGYKRYFGGNSIEVGFGKDAKLTTQKKFDLGKLLA